MGHSRLIRGLRKGCRVLLEQHAASAAISLSRGSTRTAAKSAAFALKGKGFCAFPVPHLVVRQSAASAATQNWHAVCNRAQGISWTYGSRSLEMEIAAAAHGRDLSGRDQRRGALK